MSEEMNNELMNEESKNLAADISVEEGGSGKAIGLTIGLITGAIGLGSLAYKKYKSKKKDDQPRKKKPKKRLKWVDVEEVDESESELEDVASEEIDEEAAEE